MTHEEITNLLVSSGLCQRDEVVGCSLQEIAELEAVLGPLPAAYRQFLLAAGKRAGVYFHGTDMFFADIPSLKKWALELLADANEDFALLSDAIVFSVHQGYQFNYFRHVDGNDPPVHQYVEGKGYVGVVWKSFSDFIRHSVAWHVQMLKGNAP